MAAATARHTVMSRFDQKLGHSEEEEDDVITDMETFGKKKNLFDCLALIRFYAKASMSSMSIIQTTKTTLFRKCCFSLLQIGLTANELFN